MRPGEDLAAEERETAGIQPFASPGKSLKRAIVIGELLVSWASSPLLKALPVAPKEWLVIKIYIYILKISALTSVKLESREGGEEVRRVGIINQNVVLPLIKSTNLFVTKPLWVDGKRRGMRSCRCLMAAATNRSLRKAEPHAEIRWPRCLYTAFSASEKKTSDHLCQAEKEGEGRAIAARQSGGRGGGGKRRGLEREGWKPSPCAASSPARRLQCASASPAAAAARATGTARERVREAKSDKREDGEWKKATQKSWQCCAGRDAVCLWSPLTSRRM